MSDFKTEPPLISADAVLLTNEDGTSRIIEPIASPQTEGELLDAIRSMVGRHGFHGWECACQPCEETAALRKRLNQLREQESH